MDPTVVIGDCQLYLGDCLNVLPFLPDCSVDSIVTDPPYGLGFMGKHWDHGVPSAEIWRECLRVLKPGGHLLAFAGTRTQHRMAVNIEDAGFEIRDMIAWVYGSGFPKSLDVSKAIDKAAGAEREVIGPNTTRHGGGVGSLHGGGIKADVGVITAPATDAARQWQGWGTALKPALEPITVARKPLIGTVADNVLAHGTGALNIDGCRVGDSKDVPASISRASAGNSLSGSADGSLRRETGLESGHNPNVGRWPANLIHDGEAAADLLADAARFFYCAKASKRDRDEGCDALPAKDWSKDGAPIPQRANRPFIPSRNNHPTVKPTDLMRYLCRLVTPPGGVVLDPFTGSGSTGKAAVLEGFRFIGIEREEEYIKISVERIKAAFIHSWE